jgi:hypothetical protein
VSLLTESANQQLKRLEKEHQAATCPPTPSRPSLTPHKDAGRLAAEVGLSAQEELEAMRNKLSIRDQEVKVRRGKRIRWANCYRRI